MDQVLENPKIKKVEARTLSGFMELLPKDQLKFNKIYDTIRKTYEKFGFLPLDTPVIEASEVLLAKAGGETEKQIYQIKRGDSDLTLRFDLTVPLAKYVAKNYGQLTFPFRRYQIGKVYRGERAQKGRFREFYQCDIDIIGDGELSIINDAEIPFIIYKLFKKLNLGNFVIKINNRKIITGFLECLNVGDKATEVMRIIDKLPKVGINRVKEELNQVITERWYVENIIDFFNIKGNNNFIIEELKKHQFSNHNSTFEEGLRELEQVMHYAELFGVKEKNLQIDLTISRGLDYYTGTVYETFLVKHPELGSICSGGRYDNLAEYYTDKKLPGVGISIGLTRLFDKLLDLNILNDTPNRVVDALIIPMTNNYDYVINCYNMLVKNRKRVQILYESKSFKSIVNYATNLDVSKVIIIGDEEVQNKTITLKNLNTYEQKTDTIENIMKEFKNVKNIY